MESEKESKSQDNSNNAADTGSAWLDDLKDLSSPFTILSEARNGTQDLKPGLQDSKAGSESKAGVQNDAKPGSQEKPSLENYDSKAKDPDSNNGGKATKRDLGDLGQTLDLNKSKLDGFDHNRAVDLGKQLSSEAYSAMMRVGPSGDGKGTEAHYPGGSWEQGLNAKATKKEEVASQKIELAKDFAKEYKQITDFKTKDVDYLLFDTTVVSKQKTEMVNATNGLSDTKSKFSKTDKLHELNRSDSPVQSRERKPLTEKKPETPSERKPDNPAQEAPESRSEMQPVKDKAAEVTRPVEPFREIQRLSPERFAEVGKDVLKKINPDGSPVSKEQLAKALQNPDFKGEEAQALAAMYKGFDHLHDLSKTESWFSSKSISPEDLDKYPAAVKDQQQKIDDNFATKFWAEKNFDRFAGNDGILQKSEIEKALKDPKTSAADKENLEKLSKLVDQIGERGSLFGEKGISKTKINEHAEQILNKTDQAKMVNDITFFLSRTADARNEAKGDRSLYPAAGVTPDAIKQGLIGNCYFEAGLAALAKSNPEAIKNMIKDNKDGSYTVTFPGAPNEPITVKAPTEAELGLFNNSGKNGLWATVMEKAYGQYRDNHAWIGSYTPQEAADGGGQPRKVLELLTGKDGKTLDIDTSKPDQAAAAKLLTEAFSTVPPKAVTATSSMEWKGFFSGGWNTEGNTADGFIRNHAFTITGFKPDGKGGGEVTIRNPWGGADGTTRGNITVPLEVFLKNFRELATHK